MSKWYKTVDSDLLGNPLGLYLPNFDYASLSQSSTQDVWSFKSGGAGGTLVATITINYTDATKVTITNVTRT